MVPGVTILYVKISVWAKQENLLSILIKPFEKAHDSDVKVIYEECSKWKYSRLASNGRQFVSFVSKNPKHIGSSNFKIVNFNLR